MLSRRDWLKHALQFTVLASVPPLLLSQQDTEESTLTSKESVAARSQTPQKTPPVVREKADLLAKEKDLRAAYPLIPTSAMVVRSSHERGHANHGWLNTYHSFSFANYYDPNHMGFRSLRVINEDRIAGGGGFPMHPHCDMEIITYILDGALEHKDSLHNGSVIRPGEIQRMTAGTGIRHSEFNPRKEQSVHLLQIWLLPDKRGHRPSYAQRTIKPHTRQQPVRLIASPEQSHQQLGAVTIHQDVYLYACKLQPKQSMLHLIKPRRHVWIQVARGLIQCNGQTLSAGDAVAVSQTGRLQLQANKSAEFLIFDLA
tara:strand:- start:13488 stop:14429 length:942 start_codon:yes stop_codon:yes gene_type:complete